MPKQKELENQKPEQKKGYAMASPQAIAIYMARSVQENREGIKELNQMLERLKRANEKEKEKVSTILGYAEKMMDSARKLSGSLENPDEQYKEIFKSGLDIHHLRQSMEKLSKNEPVLYNALCKPFVNFMEKEDFSKSEKMFSEMKERKDAKDKIRDNKEKKILNQEMQKTVVFYNDIKVLENSGLFFLEKIREQIVSKPGFQKDPPEIDYNLLAQLDGIIMTQVDYGIEKIVPQWQVFERRVKAEAEKRIEKKQKLYYARLAKEPETARLLKKRLEGKTWFESSSREWIEFQTKTFEKKYESAPESEEMKNQVLAALAEADEFLSNPPDELNERCGTAIEDFRKNMMGTFKRDGKSNAIQNLNMYEKGQKLLSEVTSREAGKIKGSSECIRAVLTALQPFIPEDDFQKTCDIVNQRRGLADEPMNLEFITSGMFDRANLKSGLKLTERYKKELTSDETAREAAVKIMAVRLFVNTPGGKASYLEKPVSEERVMEIAKALKECREVQEWMKGLDRRKISGLLKGHGGKLERDFRKYLSEFPAGTLENIPTLQRYLPTAKERIDELKKQAAAAGKNQNLNTDEKEAICGKAAAEIIAIRNLCKVEQKGIGLERQIPPAASGQKLSDITESLYNDKACQELLLKKDIQKKMQKGYGGDIMAEVREEYNRKLMEKQPENEKILNANTVETRKVVLRKKAETLLEKFSGMDKTTQGKTLGKFRKLLCEYSILTFSSDMSGHPERDMQWKLTKARVKQSMASDKFFQALTADVELTKEAVGWMVAGNDKKFYKKMFDRRKELIEEGSVRMTEFHPSNRGASKKKSEGYGRSSAGGIKKQVI